MISKVPEPVNTDQKRETVSADINLAPTMPLMDIKVDQDHRRAFNERARRNIAALAIADCAELTENDEDEEEEETSVKVPSPEESKVSKPAAALAVEEEPLYTMIDTTQTKRISNLDFCPSQPAEYLRGL